MGTMPKVLSEVPEIESPPEMVARLREAAQLNPLRQWREHKSVTLQEISSLVGRSISILQRWERGANVPGESDWPKLVLLTGNDNLPEEWAQWLTNIPRL